jgi:hypothetical protein
MISGALRNDPSLDTNPCSFRFLDGGVKLARSQEYKWGVDLQRKCIF